MDAFRSSLLAFETDFAPQPSLPSVVTAHLPPILAPKGVAGLCQAMRDAVTVQANRGSVICFVGSGVREKADDVSLESAMAAAAQFNLRVLLIDAVADPRGRRNPLLASLKATLYETLTADTPLDDAFTVVADTGLTYACLNRAAHNEAVIGTLDSFQELMERLRFSYDLIVLNAPSVMDGALGAELVKLADGTVLVIEAERTRVPVAQRTKQIIEAAGGRLIGAVLNNRRFYIPSIFYRRL